MPLSVAEPEAEGVSLSIELSQLVCHRVTPFQEIIVGDTPGYGRALFLDGLIQSAESDEAFYHEALIHPALVLHGAPRRVLVCGAGEGASLREIVRHDAVERVLAVDLDRDVVEVSLAHLEAWHRGAFQDPRVELRYEDAMDTLRNSEAAAWDVVILDITDPAIDGPSVELFTARTFELVRRVLAPGGIVVLQAGELDPGGMRITRRVRATLERVFPWVHFLHTFVPSFHCAWGIALCGSAAPQITDAEIDERIARLDASELRVYDATTHRAMMHLPKLFARLLAEAAEPITGLDEERLHAYGPR
jgi:spermidine synthase